MQEENTHELCKLIDGPGPNSLFIGDFNFPAIDWLHETSNRKSSIFLETTREKLCETGGISNTHS